MEKIDSKENLIRLVEQYQNLIFSICLKLTGDYFAAEDLTQETFLSAYKCMNSFDGENEKAWLCRIASNKAVDYLRAAKRREVPTLQEEMTTETVEISNEPLQQVLNKEVMEEMIHKCQSLKPPYDEIAMEFFIKGKSAKEIASQKNESLKTIQTRLYRAREMLRNTIGKEVP